MKTRKYWRIIYFSLLLFFLKGCVPQDPANQVNNKPPNVVFIFADQFRNYSLGIWSKPGYSEHLQGNPDPVSTPALDKLASQGVLFSQAISNFPLCSPYRAMLLSGMYPDQNGATN